MIEVRDNNDGTRTLRAYASLFMPVKYQLGRGEMAFDEDVHPEAFRKSLAQSPDIVFRTEHHGPPLARTSAGTLRVGTDTKGLWYEARLNPKDPDVAALIPKVESGAYAESSFAFRSVRDRWNSDRTCRTLMECDLHRGDVSAVTFGASPATGREGMTLRGDQTSLQERRAMAEAITASHWGGPGAMIYRGTFSNQHGATCTNCNGAKQVDCPSCDGKGWVPNSGSDHAPIGQGGRSSTVPPSRIPEFEAMLAEAKARSREWANR